MIAFAHADKKEIFQKDNEEKLNDLNTLINCHFKEIGVFLNTEPSDISTNQPPKLIDSDYIKICENIDKIAYMVLIVDDIFQHIKVGDDINNMHKQIFREYENFHL